MAKNKFKLFSVFLLVGLFLIGIASASYSSEFNSIQKKIDVGNEIGNEIGNQFEQDKESPKELTKEELQKEINIEKDVKNILGTSYKIKEHKWWDLFKIWTEDEVKEITLEDNSFECSNDCYAIIEVTNNKPMPLIDEVLWKRDFGDGRGFVDYKGFSNWRVLVYDEIIDYDYSCSVEEKFDSVNETSYNETSCEQVVIGSHYDWIRYDYNKNYEGTYKLKLVGSKKDNVVYDWIIKSNGQLTSEWAVWGSIGDGADAEVTLNYPTDNSIALSNPVTFNASAIVNGADLVNASFCSDIGGSWGCGDSLDLVNVDGLVSYYKLDETSGSVAYDSMGRNNGTYMNSPSLNQAGVIDKSVYFDSNKYADMSNLGISGGDIRTVSAWIKLSSTIQSSWSGIVGWKGTSNSAGAYFNLGFDNLDNLDLHVQHNDWPIESSANLGTSEWYHVVISYTGSRVYVYLNNILKVNQSYSSLNTDGYFTIGGGINQNSKVYVDEVSIWNRSLTAGEISELYNSGAGKRPTDTGEFQTWDINIPAGTTTWNVEYCDSDGDCGQAISNYSVTRDATIPQFDITSNPTIMDISQNHSINFSVTDVNLNTTWYEYDGVNTTITGVTSGVEKEFNFTLNPDVLTLTLYANDLVGNVNSQEVTLTIDHIEPTITIQNGEGLQDYGVININHEINFSVEDDNLDKVWYEYNGSNKTILTLENPWRYTNWGSSEPNNNGNNEDYLQFVTGGKWNDVVGSSSLYALCEFPNKTYHKSSSRMNWNDAKVYCEGLEGNLAVIRDATENAAAFAVGGTNSWLGGYQINKSNEPAGNWAWVDSYLGVDLNEDIIISIPLEKDLYTTTIYASDTAGNLESYQVDWSYKVWENERVYSNETFETKDETFTINITSDKVSKVWLNYNGLDYETNNINPYNVTINIPPTQTNTNRTFYWKFLYNNSENITSKIDEHLVKTFKLNWTGDKQLIKFEIRDEFDNSLINNTDLRLLGEYYIDGNGYTKILDEFKTADGSYDFKSTPNIESVRIQGEAFYQAIGYQPRYYFFDDEVFTNSSLTTKTFYLSLYSDGILVRYKIVDSAANPIKNVRISAKKIIGQQKILVEQVLTDDEGEASLFLDPNYYHDIIIEKETCQTITKNRRITSSEQTMEVLNCNLEPDEPSLPLVTFNKVSFKFLPNTIPSNAQGNYALSLETKDKNCELTKSEFVLTYNGNVLDTQTKLNDCGDTFNSIVNTSTINGYLVVKGTVWKDDLSMTESKSYYIYDNSGLIYNESSVADILENFKNNTFGDKLGLSEKSRILITFLILFGIISALSINDRGMKDSVPIILIASNLYLWAMSYIGFLTLPADLVSIKVIQQYGIAVLTSILSFFGYYIGKGR